MIDAHTFFRELFKKRSIDKVKKTYPDITEEDIEAFFHQVLNEPGKTEYKLYVDGASSSNPGPAGIGVVLKRNNHIIKKISKYIGEATNNIAEYTALIEGLELARSLKIDRIDVFSDSELVVKQINGEYAVRDRKLKELFDKVVELIESFDHVSIKHISRNENSLADKLAKSSVKNSSKFS